MVGNIKSSERVQKYGEVNTPSNLVSDMLQLVDFETKRIDSRFLEPACGDGNFLSQVIDKKFYYLKNKYHNNKYEFEKNSIIIFGSVYGIDILKDNVEKTKKRLFDIFNSIYSVKFAKDTNYNLLSSINYVLNRNIIHGNALTLKKVDNDELITFCEWTMINNKVKRRDFTFNELVSYSPFEDGTLFSDLGEGVFIPSPKKEYPLKNFDRVFEYDN